MVSVTTPRRTYTVLDSPLGPLTLVALGGALTGLHLDRQQHVPEVHGEPDATAFGVVEEQLAAYFAGTLSVFDVPLAPVGTDFQRRVWAALRRIPCGQTTTYGRIAAGLGSPGASRAVGLANGRNPIGIIVPCHRVVGSDGRLIGYGGGLERKQWLLAHERAQAGLAPALGRPDAAARDVRRRGLAAGADPLAGRQGHRHRAARGR